MRTQTRWMLTLLFGVTLLPVGCSQRDPPTYTPDFKVGTPTNRSTVNSWEINGQPFYTQPGANHGTHVVVKPIPSQLGFEPYDPLAEAVYQALITDGTVTTRYLSPRAKNGVVILVGTVDSAAQMARAAQIARAVPGVKRVKNQLTVVKPAGP